LISELADRVGESYSLDPRSVDEEAYKVDLKTAIRLTSSRFRLDR
jgi:hypothetical protein